MIGVRRGPGAEPRLRRAALATALVFAVNGFVAASWVSRLPATRDRLGASAAELGLVLLADQVGLGRALLVLCRLAGGIAALAPAVRSRRPRPAAVRP